jgi:hypothetical protein
LKRAIYCGLISAVVGFVVAAWLSTAGPKTIPRMNPIVAFILCPPGLLAALSVTDPDPESIWLFFAPVNGLIYGAIGFTLWLYLVGDHEEPTAAKDETRDRPLNL